jgi:hypothetical protein
MGPGHSYAGVSEWHHKGLGCGNTQMHLDSGGQRHETRPNWLTSYEDQLSRLFKLMSIRTCRYSIFIFT